MVVFIEQLHAGDALGTDRACHEGATHLLMILHGWSVGDRHGSERLDLVGRGTHVSRRGEQQDVESIVRWTAGCSEEVRRGVGDSRRYPVENRADLAGC